MAKHSKEEVGRLIKEINKDYDFIGEYVNNATPLKIRHAICGGFFERTLGNFKRSQKCPHCQGGRTIWDTEKVKRFIAEKTEGNYSLVSDYIHFKKYITVKHNECNNEYRVTFDAFKSGNRCPQCGKKSMAKKQRKTQEKFIEEVRELTNGEFDVVSTYKGAFREVKLFHSLCGKTIIKTPHGFLNKPSCPNCGGFREWTTELFNAYIRDITSNEYLVIGEYVTDKKGKTTFVHNQCGRHFKMLASNFTSGNQRCPFCKPNPSKAEIKIREFLEEWGIDFIEQYRFNDCIDKTVLPFDFAVIENNKPIGLIEYDGIQHYRGWGCDKVDLANIKRRDDIKNSYCKMNNIPLFRINYKKYNDLRNEVKEAIKWIRQQNMPKTSSLDKY